MKLPTVIAGPCSMESYELMKFVAVEVKSICKKLNFDYVFKSSFQKANRSALNSYTGPGIETGFSWLSRLREEIDVKTTTDIHEPWQAEKIREVVDIIQIPALLSRQTDLLVEAAKQNRIVNIKKGQFMSPWKINLLVEKVASQNPPEIIITERGSFFGYGDLIVDFRSLPKIRETGVKVGFDATHSVQRPQDNSINSGGNPEFIEPLSLAASAIGVDYLFFEVHPNPSGALSDGDCMLNLDYLEQTLSKVKSVHEALHN